MDKYGNKFVNVSIYDNFHVTMLIKLGTYVDILIFKVSGRGQCAFVRE